jgi:sulfur relay (sulfurtransferase) DsrC/TusE family protein
MLVSSTDLLEGMKVELEHKGTYLWIEDYFKKYKKMPSLKDFVMRIANDHLTGEKKPDYYKRLKKAGL